MKDFGSISVCALILFMLFGTILIGVGVFHTRAIYSREMKALRDELDLLKNNFEKLSKNGCTTIS